MLESENALDEEDEFSGDNTNVSLGEWMNQPRKSRQIAGKDPVEICVDFDLVANHGTTENDLSLLRAVIGNNTCDLSRFETTYKDNKILRKAVNVQKL